MAAIIFIAATRTTVEFKYNDWRADHSSYPNARVTSAITPFIAWYPFGASASLARQLYVNGS